MKILMLTREYPPHVYGGAGVHVEHLAGELAGISDVEVRCFGEQSVPGKAGRPTARGFSPLPGSADLAVGMDPRLWKAFEPLITDLVMAGEPVDADVVHCHTWYTMMAGLWIKLLHGIPLVITTHSLEPLRPWKEEQLGRGYHLSSWIEKTAIEAADAVIAVSAGTRNEVLDCYSLADRKLHVIHNGIDLERYRRTDARAVYRKYGVDPEKPVILFVGRITRQKGILHLLRALRRVRPDAQVVLCAGAPDTREIGEKTARAIAALRAERDGVHWISEMVPVSDVVPLYSGASVFVCPSIYEPFGIINLEAMACETPVVASRVGGIPEVVVHEKTGLLVPVERCESPDFEPRDADRFAGDLAAAIDSVLGDPDRARSMGRAGRDRVEELFGWESIAGQTLELYRSLAAIGN